MAPDHSQIRAGGLWGEGPRSSGQATDLSSVGMPPLTHTERAQLIAPASAGIQPEASGRGATARPLLTSKRETLVGSAGRLTPAGKAFYSESGKGPRRPLRPGAALDPVAAHGPRARPWRRCSEVGQDLHPSDADVFCRWPRAALL